MVDKGIKRLLLLWIILTSIIISLNAKEVIYLKEGVEKYDNFNLEYFEDTSEKPLGFEQIREKKFKTLNSAFTFGYNTNNFWFRMTVTNSSQSSNEIYLEFTEIIHKELDLYVIESGVTKQIRNGLHIPVNERDIKVSTPTFSLTFKPGETKEIYLKLSSIYTVFGEFRLLSPEKFHELYQLKENLYMFYFGAIITLALYNLFIYLFLREKVYLYYVSYVFVFIVWSSNYKGLLLPYSSMEIYDILQVTVPTFFTLLILFSQAVLETKKKFAKFHKVLNFYILIQVISFVLMLIDMHIGFYFVNMAASPLLPLLIIIAFWALYKGHSIAKIYLLALSIYLISLVILSQAALGLLPYTLLISNAPIIGSFFEITLLSLMLAYRINFLREEKLESQQKLLTQKASESMRLTTMVEEKTAALTQLNAQLAVELEEKERLEKILMHKASTDSLTGMLNRRSFFETCADEVEISKLNGYDISFMIIDIDHFKMINDTYGHLNGDIILKDVVKCIKESIRSSDILGRIGGEEFALLMPQTKITDAIRLAEQIRVNVAEHKSEFEEIKICVTISIGLSFLTNEDKIIQTVLRRADLALIKAKENGRNQVLCHKDC